MGDRLVILVDVVVRGLEDNVRLPFVPELDEKLEDVLATLGERAYVEVVAVAARTSRASVSGSKPGGSERVAMEKAT